MNTRFRIETEDDDFWLQDVQRCLSPNHDTRPAGVGINLLVVHGISLPPGQYGGEYIDQLFCNRLDPDEHPYFSEIQDLQVSSHLLVNRQGEVKQYVPLNLRAWHAGESEFCGQKQCNDFSIGIELEGCDDDPYEPCQYLVLAGITHALMQQWPGINRQRIVGHRDIAPGRKTDPGPAFDWPHFFTELDRVN
ncbi:MAG: 1,6-anhydro-N-acetylmuramyl-L-alanine amidase AmpD [Thiotrichales bacterium]|nr:1,6-anhydro-N-acetylmuramyl-L-alanine amidase AmpD [Thiotrichales bacterium]